MRNRRKQARQCYRLLTGIVELTAMNVEEVFCGNSSPTEKERKTSRSQLVFLVSNRQCSPRKKTVEFSFSSKPRHLEQRRTKEWWATHLPPSPTLFVFLPSCNGNLAAAQGQAAWQRIANCILVHDDPKRALNYYFLAVRTFTAVWFWSN